MISHQPVTKRYQLKPGDKIESGEGPFGAAKRYKRTARPANSESGVTHVMTIRERERLPRFARRT